MYYAKLSKSLCSFNLSLIFVLSIITNVVADDVVTYADGTVPVYYNAEMTPDEAYRQLVAGNARYLKEDSVAAQALPRLTTAQNRFPIASVIYSSDMPVTPNVLTQTSDHDLYLMPIDSGAVSTDDMASIEYGLINLQTPLLVVMGHYPSRIVSTLIRQYDLLEEQSKAETTRIKTSSAIPRGTTSDQMRLYNLVGPAVARSREAYPELQGYELANVVSEALVWQSLETILMKSTVAQDLIRAGKLNVIAAIADDKTGKVYWLGAHPLQEEFLKPIPETLADKEAVGILTEADLPSPLDDATIQGYVSLYESNPYYEDVVSEYYTSPIFYQPSWELFSPRVWIYRPWYGVWYEPFVPWPYWSPWGVPYGESVFGVSQWDGRLRFFVAYNRSFGVPVYYDPHFRPHDAWWGSDYFVRLDHRRHDVVFDLIIDGRRREVPRDPHHWGVPRDRHEYRSGAARPGIVVGLGGLSIGITGPPRRPVPEPGRPGGPVPRVDLREPQKPRPIRPNGSPIPVTRPRDGVPRVNPTERPTPNVISDSIPRGDGPRTGSRGRLNPNPTRPQTGETERERPLPNPSVRPNRSPSPASPNSNGSSSNDTTRPNPNVRPPHNSTERQVLPPRDLRPNPEAGTRSNRNINNSAVQNPNVSPANGITRQSPSARPNPETGIRSGRDTSIPAVQNLNVSPSNNITRPSPSARPNPETGIRSGRNTSTPTIRNLNVSPPNSVTRPNSGIRPPFNSTERQLQPPRDVRSNPEIGIRSGRNNNSTIRNPSVLPSNSMTRPNSSARPPFNSIERQVPSPRDVRPFVDAGSRSGENLSPMTRNSGAVQRVNEPRERPAFRAEPFQPPRQNVGNNDALASMKHGSRPNGR